MGDNKTASAPHARARCAAFRLWADVVIKLGRKRQKSLRDQFERDVSGICTPSQTRIWGGCSQEISIETWFRRQILEIYCTTESRFSGDLDRTMTAEPCGNNGISIDGSGKRSSSVINTKRGTLIPAHVLFRWSLAKAGRCVVLITSL